MPTCRFWGYILLIESLEMLLNVTKSAPRSEAVTAAFILPCSPAVQRSAAGLHQPCCAADTQRHEPSETAHLHLQKYLLSISY